MEIKKRTEPPADLIVKSGSDVFLTIIVGNRQIGGSKLQFSDEDEPFAKGKIKKEPLGKGKTLFDRKLLVQTNVLDSNTAHNRIIFTHLFHYEDETEIGSFEITDTVDNHEDILSSEATYNFKKSK